MRGSVFYHTDVLSAIMFLVSKTNVPKRALIGHSLADIWHLVVPYIRSNGTK